MERVCNMPDEKVLTREQSIFKAATRAKWKGKEPPILDNEYGKKCLHRAENWLKRHPPKKA
jgi:hypothetical protein